MNHIARQFFTTLLLFLFMSSTLLCQNAELITQKINVENAIRDKVSVTINKLVNRNDYVIIVNARMDLKPSFQLESNNNTSISDDLNKNTSYNPIPGLLPTVPMQNIQEPQGSSAFNYSTDKYLLYGLDIAVYLDEDIASGALQQNINRLVLDAIPEIIDCNDCIRFETMQMDNSTDSNYQEMINKVENLEKEKRDAEEQIMNWKFDQLEQQLTIAEDARNEWEAQAREREKQRDRADSATLAELKEIEKEYRAKQDALYELTSFKLDKAIQSRMDSDAETKAELIDIIKNQINNDDADVVTSDAPTDLEMQKSSYGQSNMILYIVGSIILLLLMALLFIVIRNQKPTPVYLKPKSNSNNSESSNAATETAQGSINTSAHENLDVKRSELNSLRQSAVSMGVGQKDGATQIVKDWIDSESTSNDSDDLEKEN